VLYFPQHLIIGIWRDKSKKDEIDMQQHEGNEKRIQNFSRKPTGKRPLGRLSCEWENNIKSDLTYILCENVKWIHLAQNRVQ
jgi:hypothetical protein